MPMQIEALPKSSRGRSSKYDFTELYDGNVWVIVRGDDFDCEVASIRQRIYREVAEKLNKSVKSTETTVGEGDDEKEALAFQVIDEEPKKRGPRKPKTDEEKAEAEAKKQAKAEAVKAEADKADKAANGQKQNASK